VTTSHLPGLHPDVGGRIAPNFDDLPFDGIFKAPRDSHFGSYLQALRHFTHHGSVLKIERSRFVRLELLGLGAGAVLLAAGVLAAHV
jgi:hypothetical protein